MVQGYSGVDPAALSLGQFGPAVAVVCLYAGIRLWRSGFASRSRAVPGRKGFVPLPRAVPGRRVVVNLVVLVGGCVVLGAMVMVGMRWHGTGLVGPSPVGGVPFVVFLVLQLFGAVGEEIGWRGFMQPVLESRFGRLAAVLTTGTVWALWHTPAYTHGPVVAVSFFVSVVAFAVLLGYLAEGSVRQRIAVASIGHWLINIALYLAVGDDTLVRPQVTFTAVAAAVVAATAVGAQAWTTRAGTASAQPHRSAI